jgi:hypothetical protein
MLLLPAQAEGQEQQRFDGSAVIRVDDNEYTIRIECDARARPERGFGTEPNRITRADTGGRSNMVSLRLRQWRDTGEVLVTLDGFLAWIPRPTSEAGILALDLDMSPTSVVRDGVPTAVTYDMWHSGDRPPGKGGVEIVADCTRRDPAAPSHRKLPGQDVDRAARTGPSCASSSPPAIRRASSSAVTAPRSKVPSTRPLRSTTKRSPSAKA